MYKKVKKLLTFIIVYTCSLQMAFAGINFRSPSSTSQADLDLFVKRVENYKKTIKGYEKPNDCKEEEARPDFDFSGSFENIISSDGVSDEAFFSEMKKRHQLSCDAKSKNEDPKAASLRSQEWFFLVCSFKWPKGPHTRLFLLLIKKRLDLLLVLLLREEILGQ